VREKYCSLAEKVRLIIQTSPNEQGEYLFHCISPPGAVDAHATGQRSWWLNDIGFLLGMPTDIGPTLVALVGNKRC